jgi:leucyl aminopeptidase
MVDIILEKPDLEKRETSMLVIGVFENNNDNNHLKQLNPDMHRVVNDILEAKQFIGKLGSSLIISVTGNGKIKKILLAGLGKKDKFTNENARIMSGKSALRARELNLKEFSILPFSEPNEGLLEAMSEGILLSLYTFDKYKTSHEKVDMKPEEAIILINSDNEDKLRSVINRANAVSRAVNFTRDLGNLPPNDCSPSQLVSHCLSMSDEYGLQIRVVERYEMESMGLNGIVSVGKGSNNPPKMITLQYQGVSANQKPYLMVGKAVTFDTGGISLKPSEKMDEMKFDKCGGCTVIGVMKAAAALKLQLNLVCVIPCVENMPSSTSYRPGDIIKMYNGKTVEVLNTDAEGRIILADAIAYGVETFKPKLIIDLATLTGACIIALGANVAAMIGTNSQLIERLRTISEETAEKMWQLPLWEEFHEQIKSTFADMKNVGGRPGGAITAAAFLSNYTSHVPWVHLDIAGTAWTQDGTYDKSYNPKGATGFGIRTLIKLLFEEVNNPIQL